MTAPAQQRLRGLVDHRPTGSSKLHYDAYPFPWLNTLSKDPPPPFDSIKQNRNTDAVSAQVEPYKKLFEDSGCSCQGEKVQLPATDGISQSRCTTGRDLSSLELTMTLSSLCLSSARSVRVQCHLRMRSSLRQSRRPA
jgi:hypothetical protein